MEQNEQIPVSKTKAHRSEEQIAACLKEQQRSSLTIKEYCESIDISENTFYRWRNNYGMQTEKPIAKNNASAYLNGCRYVRKNQSQSLMS